MGYDSQTLLPFAAKGNKKLKAAANNAQEPKPVVIRMHHLGHPHWPISVRVSGKWHHNQILSAPLYLSAPGYIRERILMAEFEHGISLVEGSSVLVSRAKPQSAGFGGSFNQNNGKEETLG
jgi:hypothetical protein